LSASARFNNRPGFRNFKVGFRCASDVGSTAGIDSPDPAAALASRPGPSATK
jgi:hypothetical protein